MKLAGLTSVGNRNKTIHLFFLIVFLFSGFSDIVAQYFGRNKPGYKKFDYDVIQTPNLEIYHDRINDSLLTDFSIWAEDWYGIHQKVFKDTFDKKNPIIVYSTHADFQQTTAINSMIGQGTGGVTEGFKNRVVMPFAATLSQTDHVLGHELVHAFQYHLLLHNDTSKRYSLNYLPLWMIEGMAEYLSIGSLDPNTAMWMRDALFNKDFPSIKQLSSDPNYFPYRYGQAFWALIGKTWGDSLIIPIFEKTARFGLDKALESTLGFDSKTLSGMWKSASETYYSRFLDTTFKVYGEKTFSKKNSGRMNLSPQLSPDGRYLAFFSEKDIFTLDLFIADVEKGKIIRKISSISQNNEIDDFSFIESGGTWSPDGKNFAFVVFSKGKNKLAIMDLKKGKITDEIELKGIPSFSNPMWSPDGRYIVVSGQKAAVTDLYLYDLQTKKIRQLTDDNFAEIHPSWSPDGQFIVYSKEEINPLLNTKRYTFNINILNVHSGLNRKVDVFAGASNMNPYFSGDGKSVYFLSDADGFRNLYLYHTESDKVFRLTEYVTGISGITAYSPAISIARNSNAVAYTYYFNRNYEIYIAHQDEFPLNEVDKRNIYFEAAVLPPLNYLKSNLVNNSLTNRMKARAPITPDSIKEVSYRPKFKLDYISNTGTIGVSTGRFYNNNMQGSVNMIFSDIVGNNQIYSMLAINGEIYDFAGVVAYMNQKSRIKWGASVSHIPYRSGYMFYTLDTLSIGDEKFVANDLVLDYMRMFEDNISFFSYYPFSQTRRLEAGITASRYSFRIDRYHNYYDDFGMPVGFDREKMTAPKGDSYQKIDLAYVEDNSFYGMTSPMQGHRSRYSVEKYFGVIDFYTALLDYRKYVFLKPVSLAFRMYHYGRYGNGSETRMVSPIYVGYPWLVRGYENLNFYEDIPGANNSMNVSNLAGSKVLVGNVEFRMPLTGPERLAFLKSKWFMTDLNLFFDAGLAWSKGDKINLKWNTATFNEKIPVYSAGASIRINVFGYLVVEPYYAVPFQNGGWKNRVFGVNFTPGW